MKLTSKLKVALKSLLSVSLAEITTDKAVLIVDGELAEGLEVFVRDEEAEDGVKPAEDGTYETETQVIEVEDGKIAKITEKDIEVEQRRAEFINVKAEKEESYQDKERKIMDAVLAKGFDAYLIEAGDDFAIVEIWNEANGDWHDYKFEVSWDAEGNAVVGDPIEVEPAFVPVDEKPVEEPEVVVEQAEDEPADEPEKETASIEDRLAAVEGIVNEVRDALEQILNGVASLEGRIDAIEEKIAKLDETPADEPADEIVVEQSDENRSIMSYLRKK